MLPLLRPIGEFLWVFVLIQAQRAGVFRGRGGGAADGAGEQRRYLYESSPGMRDRSRVAKPIAENLVPVYPINTALFKMAFAATSSFTGAAVQAKAVKAAASRSQLAVKAEVYPVRRQGAA